MLTNAFTHRPTPPSEQELASVLGEAKAVWDDLAGSLGRDCGATELEWKCYSPKVGWSARLKRKARTIVWLTPSTGAFSATFVLGPKAMAAARAENLPKAVVKCLDAAPKYPEGFGVCLDMSKPGDLAGARALAAVKVAN